MSTMTKDVDVAIIGGALSGASAAILLKRALPGCRVLIIERSTEFDRKVGESTSEVAGCFLTKVLGLSDYLARNHITKHGLRMWFTSPDNTCFGKCSEIGSKYQVRLPTYQVDRSELDAHLLEKAQKAGCGLLRPTTVRDIGLGGVGENIIRLKDDDGEREIRAKWVIDASGKAARIARQRETLNKLENHPTSSMWCRFSNVGDLDNDDLNERYPGYADAVFCPRSSATNHLMGYGWWCWIIPLKNGDVSAGLTWDERLFTPPEGASIAERLQKHIVGHPVGRELFGDARPVEKDARTYSNISYYNSDTIGDGWVCVGDAAGFMDPLYSQGIDYCGHTVYAATCLVVKSLQGECVKEDVVRHRESYRGSYSRWFNALYLDKYHYLGDAELMHAAFLLDIGTYFIGPVRLVYEQADSEFRLLPYSGMGGKIFGKFMALYNRRLSALARKRRAAGVYGENNIGHRYLVEAGFAPEPAAAFKQILRGVRIWLKCELKGLFLRPLPGSGRGEPEDTPPTKNAEGPVLVR